MTQTYDRQAAAKARGECGAHLKSGWNSVCHVRATTPTGWCKTHDPERVAAREAAKRAEREERYQARAARRDRQDRISAARDRVLEYALEADPRQLPERVAAAVEAYKAARGY